MKVSRFVYAAGLSLVAIAAMASTSAAALLINEIDSDSVNTPSTDAFEFVELFDTSGTSVPLDGYVLVYWNGNGDVSHLALDLDGQSTTATGYFTAGSIAGANLAVPSNTLQNGPDAVGLYLGDASSFPNGTALTTANLVDAVVYDTGDADDAGLLTLLLAGGEVDEFGRDGTSASGAADSIGRFPNGSGGLRDTTKWTFMVPSPGASNGVPEPSAMLLLAFAGAAFGVVRRQR
jgi:hypothetical protein